VFVAGKQHRRRKRRCSVLGNVRCLFIINSMVNHVFSCRKTRLRSKLIAMCLHSTTTESDLFDLITKKKVKIKMLNQKERGLAARDATKRERKYIYVQVTELNNGANKEEGTGG
jgi:hypothetical protein